jgi:hypothetical protein
VSTFIIEINAISYGEKIATEGVSNVLLVNDNSAINI